MIENSALKTEVARLNCKTTELDASLDETDQYNRRECLVIRGIRVTEEEDTSLIVANVASMINVDINREDISISHRLKVKKKTNKANPPPIIAKFVRREDRDDLYSARKSLKDFRTKNLEG